MSSLELHICVLKLGSPIPLTQEFTHEDLGLVF